MTDRLESTKNEGGRRGRAVSTGAGFGLAGAVIAYVFWGLMPLYWHLMAAVDSVEVLAHRIVWSFVFIGAVLVATGRTGEALRHIRAVFTKTHAPMARVIIAASAFASANWLINILGVNTGRVVELGIGTFLTPLATAAIGICVFRERISKLRAAALGVAALGVAALVVGLDRFPTIALSVSATWAIYGALKKKVTLAPLESVMLEHALMLPFALAWLLLGNGGSAALRFFEGFDGISWVLMGTGVVTSIPMILFSLAAQRLPFTVLGIIQFLSPVLTLLLGVFVFAEPLGTAQAAAIACVVVAAVLFVAGGREERKRAAGGEEK